MTSRANPNYRQGKIYKLYSSDDPDNVYVGSTTQTLKDRFSCHRKDSKRNTHMKIYTHFNSIGWANVSIELIEEVPCNSRTELVKREQSYIDLLSATLNSCNAYVNCPHGALHARCVPCNGTGICEHKRVRIFCVDCCGNRICEHKRVKNLCPDCGGASICQHRLERRNCKQCNPNKFHCDICQKQYSGKSSLKAHLKTQKHLRNLQKQQDQ